MKVVLYRSSSHPQRKKAKWRPPTKQQLALEQEMKEAVLAYLAKNITRAKLKERLIALIANAKQLGKDEAQQRIAQKSVVKRNSTSEDDESIQSADTLVDAIVDRNDALSDEDYADMVASTEVHSAVQQGAVDLYDDYGLPIVWVTEDKPCPICQANEDEGAIAAGLAFESGDTEPPSHPRCRCHVDYAD